MPEQFQIPNFEHDATPLEHGDVLAFHESDLSPLEQVQALAAVTQTAENSTQQSPERKLPAQHETIALLGRYIAHFRDEELGRDRVA